MFSSIPSCKVTQMYRLSMRMTNMNHLNMYKETPPRFYHFYDPLGVPSGAVFRLNRKGSQVRFLVGSKKNFSKLALNCVCSETPALNLLVLRNTIMLQFFSLRH